MYDHDKDCKCEKPPLGLRPRSVWLWDRVYEIYAAIERYRAVKKDVPMEWIDELVALNREIDAIENGSF